MITGTHSQTAKIYIFPKRPGAAAQPRETTPAPGQWPICDAASGGAWYHEEAVKEEQPPLKS
jgi:hypothetical protein